MSFDEKHDEGIKLFMAVDNTNQMAGIALSEYCEYIFQSRLKQVTELLLSDQFKQGGLEWISTHAVEELHACRVVVLFNLLIPAIHRFSRGVLDDHREGNNDRRLAQSSDGRIAESTV
jgi:hypothetical protein